MRFYLHHKQMLALSLCALLLHTLDGVSQAPQARMPISRDPLVIRQIEATVRALHPAETHGRQQQTKTYAIEKSLRSDDETDRIWEHDGRNTTIRIGKGSTSRSLSTSEDNGSTSTPSKRHSHPAFAEAYFDPFDVGALLSSWVDNQSIALRFIGTTTRADHEVLGIEAFYLVGGLKVSRRIWINNATRLPDRIDFCLPSISGSVPCYPASFDYESFTNRSGNVYAQSLLFTQAGEKQSRLTLKDISISGKDF